MPLLRLVHLLYDTSYEARGQENMTKNIKIHTKTDIYSRFLI